MLVLSGCSLVSQQAATSALPERSLIVGKANLTVEVAATDAARAQGLSDRDTLPEGRGMLFTFERPGTYGFWMHGMRFPLDFVWIAKGRVVAVTLDVPAPSFAQPEPVRLGPPEPVDVVLEVREGWVAAHGVGVGDEAQLTGEAR